MLVKTILNKVEKFKSFAYGECTFEKIGNNSSTLLRLLQEKMARDYVQNVINHHHPTINSHYVVISMCPSGIYLFILHMPRDVSIAKCTASELSSSLGVMAKNR